MANLERPWICFVFFFFCNHYVQASHLKIIYTYRHTIIFYIHLNTTNRMIQVYSGRTWLCLIIIPLRKYKNNLINRHFGAAAAQMDLVFVVAMRTGEHCVSVTDTEHGASVQFLLRRWREQQHRSVCRYIFYQTARPYHPLHAAFSSSAVSKSVTTSFPLL